MQTISADVSGETAGTRAGSTRRNERLSAVQPAGRVRVLVLDADDVVLRVTKRMLTRLGCDAVVTNDGLSAVGLFRQAQESDQPFGAVFIDPADCTSLSGLEVLARLKRLAPDLCVILSSSYCASTPVGDYAKHGFAAALSKPYTLGDLRHALMAGAPN
jgi:two-component system, cell cycle sensor histidine kinase and response regulator CckA